MFYNHEYSGYNSVELYVLLQNRHMSQTLMSQVVNPIGDEQAEVDIVEEEGEEPELEADNVMNDESEEED